MKTIQLCSYFKDFATKRWDKSLDPFVAEITLSLNKNEQVLLDLKDIKLMSVSFFDEIFRRLLAAGHKREDFSHIRFSKALDPHFTEHFDKNYR